MYWRDDLVQTKANIICRKAYSYLLKVVALLSLSSYLSPLGFCINLVGFGGWLVVFPGCRCMVLSSLFSLRPVFPSWFKTPFGRKEHWALETRAHVSEQQSGVCVSLPVLKSDDLSPEGLSSQT